MPSWGPVAATAVTALALTGPGISVTLSSSRAGANAVELRLRLVYEMQCGWPGPGPLVVVFPPAERLPASVTRAAVRLDGKPVAAVTRTGRRISIAIAPPAGVQCDVIAPGVATVVFTHAAGLGNPRTPGRYALSVQHRTTFFRTTFRIVR